jgi:hypothetical protein
MILDLNGNFTSEPILSEKSSRISQLGIGLLY